MNGCVTACPTSSRDVTPTAQLRLALNMDANADLKAAVQITPEKSQVFVLSLVGLTAISLVAGFIFLWHKPDVCWLPFSCAGISAAMAFAAWHFSHKNVDMHGATATSVSRQPDGGLSVVADARLLNSIGGQNALAQLVSIVAYRQPLPMPSGVVDNDGRPLENSRTEAVSQVACINQEIAHATEQVFGSVTKAEVGELIEQPKITSPASSAELVNRSNLLASE